MLHLSAHGSPGTVELEDEDGGPVEVTTGELMQALKHAGRTVPLIMLSSCSGGAEGTQAMAAGLLGQGADRVIAMLAPVTDDYATTLARYFYRELASRPGATVGQALAQARYLAEEERSRAGQDRLPVPEYGVATLLAAGGDGPLIDPAAGKVPLPMVTTPPGGQAGAGPAGGGADRPPRPDARHHGHLAPRPGRGRTVRGRQRGGADRGRRDRQDGRWPGG